MARGPTVGRRSLRPRRVAVDLGTANLRVAVEGRGIVLDEPSAVAWDRRSRAIVAVGAAAKRMLGRTPPHLSVIAPIGHGVIRDVEAAQELLGRAVGSTASRLGLSRTAVALSVPYSATPVEASAAVAGALRAGARDAHLVDAPVATAFGAGLLRTNALSLLVLDVGAGTTQAALVGPDGIIAGSADRVGSGDVDGAITRHVRDHHGIDIGPVTAERLKLSLATRGTSHPDPVIIRSWDGRRRFPREQQVTAGEVRALLDPHLDRVVDVLVETLEAVPVELAGVAQNGVILTGRGAGLVGLAARIRQRADLPVLTVESPGQVTALGGLTTLADAALRARTARTLRTRIASPRSGRGSGLPATQWTRVSPIRVERSSGRVGVR
jgi:rod shape-determining protein MreB and related proteins